MPSAVTRPDLDDASGRAVRDLVALAAVSGQRPGAVLADVVRAAIDGRGLPIEIAALRLVAAEGDRAPDPDIVEVVRALPAEVAIEDLLGRLHEGLLTLDHRYAKGVYYTPLDVAGRVVGLVAASWPAADAGRPPPTVCDPATGGGAFLLAAARALAALGWSRRQIVEEALWGLDLDPVAVGVAEAALAVWAGAAGEVVTRTNLLEGDTLLHGRELLASRGAPGAGFDAVVGNPPFQNQLGRSTARDGATMVKLQERFGRQVAWRYTDTAALFLLESCQAVRPGGDVALVLPQAVLVSGDARQVRDAVLDLGAVTHVWVAREAVFSVSVRVCVLVVRRSRNDMSAVVDRPVVIARRAGRGFEPVGDVELRMEDLRGPTWGALVGELFGVPMVDLDDAGGAPGGATLGSFCRATAGFRDQYYGLAPFVREASEAEREALLARVAPRPESEPHERSTTERLDGLAPLLTCGLIDPARCRWGRQETKFARRRWAAPVVDLGALAAGDPTLAAWTAARLVPKLVVSTQTRVVEAAVDTRGDWYPSVPTIAVTASPDRLWHAAAVVMAPAVTAWLLARHAGAALSHDAIKVSASQLLDVPLPGDAAAWDAAVEPLREASAATDGEVWRAAMERFGACMHVAYGGGDEVLRWWLDRLPPWR